MTRREHILLRCMEECNELSQRIAKELEFGSDQVQEDPDDKPEENPERLANHERSLREYEDLAGVMEMAGFTSLRRDNIDAKKLKVGRYLQKCKELGTLTD